MVDEELGQREPQQGMQGHAVAVAAQALAPAQRDTGIGAHLQPQRKCQPTWMQRAQQCREMRDVAQARGDADHGQQRQHGQEAEVQRSQRHADHVAEVGVGGDENVLDGIGECLVSLVDAAADHVQIVPEQHEIGGIPGDVDGGVDRQTGIGDMILPLPFLPGGYSRSATSGWKAFKSDVLSLTAWQVGMNGRMAIGIFVRFGPVAMRPGHWKFWWMMSARCCGLPARLTGELAADPPRRQESHVIAAGCRPAGNPDASIDARVQGRA